MGRDRPIVGEVMDPDGDAEALVSLMAGDPTLAADTIADVLEAAAEVHANPDTAATLISVTVDELDHVTGAFLKALTSALHRRMALHERMPFIDWLTNAVSGADDLAIRLLAVADDPSWPEPVTHVEYWNYLTGLVVAGGIDAEVLEHFRMVLWPQYLADGRAMMGDDERTTMEWQYGVEVRWGNGHRERPPEAGLGMSRLDAERLHRSLTYHDGAGTPVLQRRLSEHGPWVDVP